MKKICILLISIITLYVPLDTHTNSKRLKQKIANFKSYQPVFPPLPEDREFEITQSLWQQITDIGYNIKNNFRDPKFIGKRVITYSAFYCTMLAYQENKTKEDYATFILLPLIIDGTNTIARYLLKDTN